MSSFRERPNPGLWSLGDMLEKYGSLFTRAVVALSEAKILCFPLQLQPGERQLSDDEIARGVLNGVQLMRTACILVEMDDILPELDRLEQLVVPVSSLIPFAPRAGIAQAIVHLLSRLQDNLNAEYFFHLTKSDVSFFMNKEPFGSLVSVKFDNAREDIEEAAKCLALQRPTACIFHLMRVLELGVQALGKKMKIKIEPKEQTWYQIILHVNKAIEALPSKMASEMKKKSSYAEAASHLQSVRLAWRNEVMHPKQTYTRQEAHDIFNTTRVFMISLAKMV
jgi:hypothetical protein